MRHKNSGDDYFFRRTRVVGLISTPQRRREISMHSHLVGMFRESRCSQPIPCLPGFRGSSNTDGRTGISATGSLTTGRASQVSGVSTAVPLSY